MLIKFLPIILMLAIAWLQYRAAVAASEQDLKIKSAPLDEPALTEAVRRFEKAMDFHDLRVALYDVPMINGMATPKGGIYLTRGLVDKYRSGAFTAPELAGVIAHEIGHLALGHHERRQTAWRIEMAARAAAMAFFPRIISGLAGYAANFVARVLHLSLSRKDEYEADAFAAALMRRAGYDPEAQISLLRKLDQMTRDQRKPVAWLASHPETANRVAALERTIAADRAQSGE